jgi:hypothetical protein
VILGALLLGLTSTVFFQEPKERSIFTPLVIAVMKEADPKEMLNVPPCYSLLLPKHPMLFLTRKFSRSDQGRAADLSVQ